MAEDEPMPTEPARPGTRGVVDAHGARAAIDARYQIEAQVGAGGQGVVYRATDARLNRRVAIKMLNRVAARGDAEHEEGVLKEARAMAALNNTGLCKVHDVIIEEGQPYMVMEWIDGEPLDRAIRGLLPDQRMKVFERIVEAVSAIHQAGLVHRDLKPQNILLVNGSPKIVDFGLANSTDEGYGYGGTPGSAAPEQFRGGERVGAPADVFALGVLLFELLTNQRPFVARSSGELIRLVCETDPPLPESLAPLCASSWQRVCLAAMERDPARRYPNALALLDDVRRAMRGEAVVARPSVLASKFNQSVQDQIQSLHMWARMGLVTPVELRHLSRRLEDLLKPESSWIVGARQLHHSQVWLYVGGWLTLLAMSIGLVRSWDVLPDVLRVGLPVVMTLLMGGLGVYVFRRGSARVGLVFLLTASLALPIATTLIQRQTGWFSGDVGQPLAQLFGVVGEHGRPDAPPSHGFYNGQLLVTGLLWVATMAVLRVFTGASPFMFVAALASGGAWVALQAVLGVCQPRPFDYRLAAGSLAWSLVLLAIGLRLSNREQHDVDVLGSHRQRRFDAGCLLSIAVAGLLVELTVLAGRPSWYGLPDLLSDQELPRKALALLMNGLFIGALHGVLTQQPGQARERLATLLRWLMPVHFILPMLVFHHERLWGLRSEWLAVMVGVAAGLCWLSVQWQWKPFLVNSVLALGLAYARAFDDPLFVGREGQVGLALSGLVVSVGVMLVAWYAPSRRARSH